MKKIITHINPDLDAVTAVWLIKRFLPGWEEAKIGFVEASVTTEKQVKADEDPDTLFVDVGRGKLDHHQTGKYLSASKLCLEYIFAARKDQPLSSLEEKALEKIVEVVTQIDNARDLNWEEVNKSRYHFYLHDLIDGLRGLAKTDSQVMEFGFLALEAILLNLKNKLKAEEELKKGIEFQTPWGKGIALESGNKKVLWEGEVQGYVLVVKKDPKEGGVQIYSRADSQVDLSLAYQKIKKLDPQSDWFLHASKKLLLNQSSVNLNMRPTKLSLAQIIEVLKS
ncbi:MAG: DHH family phosphoesterase [Microgenomates group bacterium]